MNSDSSSKNYIQHFFNFSIVCEKLNLELSIVNEKFLSFYLSSVDYFVEFLLQAK